MSAHRLYCYAPQRSAIVELLREDFGAIISRDSPHAIHEAGDLQGLEHITFIVIDHHPARIPQAMWEMIVQRGALVMHFDDQFERERESGRVSIRHYAGVDSVTAETTR